MKVNLQKRLAAKILKVGEKKIWIDPSKLKEVADAITKEDIRELIERGIIRKKTEIGQCRKKARILHEKRKKGRRRGPGRRKGKKTARTGKKEMWINKVRAQRKFLKKLKGKISTSIYRKLYRMIKGGFFRDIAHLKLHLKKITGKE